MPNDDLITGAQQDDEMDPEKDLDAAILDDDMLPEEDLPIEDDTIVGGVYADEEEPEDDTIIEDSYDDVSEF